MCERQNAVHRFSPRANSLFSISLSERGKSGQRRNVTSIRRRIMIKHVSQVSGQKNASRSLLSKGTDVLYNEERRKALNSTCSTIFQLCASLAICRYQPRVSAHVSACVLDETHNVHVGTVFPPMKGKKKKKRSVMVNKSAVNNKRREEIADAEDEQSATPRTLETRWRRSRRKKKNTIQKVNTNCSVRLQCVRWIFFFFRQLPFQHWRKKKHQKC